MQINLSNLISQKFQVFQHLILFADGSSKAAKLDQPDGGEGNAERPEVYPSSTTPTVHGRQTRTRRTHAPRRCTPSLGLPPRSRSRWTPHWFSGPYPDAAASRSDHGLQDSGSKSALAAANRDGRSGNDSTKLLT